ncbi:MAG: single-stranded DNA-binding protein [Candidatus Hydrothermarchaeota archaeon]|nr:single-stranded DNA-binding protein [Candidatus Hydrothermarchaeota archaeon]
MPGVNKVVLVGNLGKTPELKKADNGETYVRTSLATNERRKKRSGGWEDHAEWHQLVFFGKTAETLSRYCKKGKLIYVEGRLQTQKWEDEEGITRWSTNILCSKMVMFGKKEE